MEEDYLSELKSKLYLSEEDVNEIITELESHLKARSYSNSTNSETKIFGNAKDLANAINKNKDQKVKDILKYRSTYKLASLFILLYLLASILLSVGYLTTFVPPFSILLELGKNALVYPLVYPLIVIIGSFSIFHIIIKERFKSVKQNSVAAFISILPFLFISFIYWIFRGFENTFSIIYLWPTFLILGVIIINLIVEEITRNIYKVFIK